MQFYRNVTQKFLLLILLSSFLPKTINRHFQSLISLVQNFSVVIFIMILKLQKY